MKRSFTLIFLDVFIITVSLILAFWLRFEFDIPNEYNGIKVRSILFTWMLPIISCQVIIFYFAGLYHRIWRFTGLIDLFSIIKSISLSTIISFALISLIINKFPHPRSVILLFYILNVAGISLSRISVRIYFTHYFNRQVFDNSNLKHKERLILIGAGITGEKIAREVISNNETPFEIIGFLDDDIKKHNHRIHGFKILGSINQISNLSINFDRILICAPSIKKDKLLKIIAECKKTGKRYQTVPSLYELIGKDVTLASIRDVSPIDLLGREEIKLDMLSIDKFIRGKRILISGAGGSIGAELLKQCINFMPSEIVCIEFSEEKIFEIELLKSTIDSRIIIKTALVDINNKVELKKIFIENKPQIVFHAAAYKHVPIQELHPWTAVNTNIGGTINLVNLSDIFKVEKFVLVSTDKAVNPTNIMGATKRLAEKIIQSKNNVSKTQFMAVRFGNVLGSSGSVIPIFQKQIKKGGPVTITHPHMTRFFMSIQEASQLIIQCGAIGKDGEIFLLDMGAPVKIDSMARDLIKLSGYIPDKDINIVYTGLRPGEKLFEELRHSGEIKLHTDHKKIMVLKGTNEIKAWHIMDIEIKNLMKISKTLDGSKIQIAIKNLLPTYQPGSSSFEDRSSYIDMNNINKWQA